MIQRERERERERQRERERERDIYIYVYVYVYVYVSIYIYMYTYERFHDHAIESVMGTSTPYMFAIRPDGRTGTLILRQQRVGNSVSS